MATHLPGDVELVVAHEIGVVALERVEDEALVRLGDVLVGETSLVRQVHLNRYRAGVKTRCLRIQLEIDRFAGLDTDDEFISGNIFEYSLSNIFVLNPNFDLRLVQSYNLDQRIKTQH